MIPSKLLHAVSQTLEAADAAGLEACTGTMVSELRQVQADLRTTLEELDAAPDDATRLAAMDRWNEFALWAEMLINALSDKLHQATRFAHVHLSPRYPHANIE